MTLLHSTHLHLVADLEPTILADESLELLGEPDVKPDVALQTGNAVGPHDEPQLETAEAAAQRDTPVAVVDGAVGVAVLEVERVDDEGGGEADTVTHPEGGAVEAGQQPLVGVCVEGVGVLDTWGGENKCKKERLDCWSKDRTVKSSLP